MSKLAVKKIINWLRPNLNPVLVQLPHKQYEKLKKSWHLPDLLNPIKTPIISSRYFLRRTRNTSVRDKNRLVASINTAYQR